MSRSGDRKEGSLLVSGASGQLGCYLLEQLAAQRRAVTAWSGTARGERSGYGLVPVDLGDAQQIEAALESARPEIILHAAAISRIDECYRDPRRAERINVDATRSITHWARQNHARLVYVSTDLVFDGTQGNYREDDVARPLSCYGRTKLAAEEEVLQYPGAVVVRVSLLYGPSLCGRPSFYDQQREALLSGRPCVLFHDEWRTPLSYSAAAQALLAIAEHPITGRLHVGGPERLSRLEMGERLAAELKVARPQFVARSRLDAPGDEPRPADTSLNSERYRRTVVPG